jgi:hypothetical protein
MWNFVTQVAKNNHLSEADLADFAISRDTTYNIVIEGGLAFVSNCHVDQLVKDFKRMQREEGNVTESVALPTDVSLRRTINPAFNKFLNKLGV